MDCFRGCALAAAVAALALSAGTAQAATISVNTTAGSAGDDLNTSADLDVDDTDGDGVIDAADNCPAFANADQANADNDAEGDACDADDDNDGVADGADSCRLIAGGGAVSGCPVASTAIALKYSDGKHRFSGPMASTKPACFSGRAVVIHRVRRGKDKAITTTISDAAGNFRVEKQAGKGRYYAVALATVVADAADCPEATSKPIRVG